VSEPPRAELLRGLAVFAEAPGPEHPAIADALGLPGVPDAAGYSDVFLFQLYPYASVHLGPEGMMGGEARDRVAGFWRALGITPPAEPDHLAALVGLYASLAEREGEVEEESERLLLVRARGALLDEHLAPWVFLFLHRVRELAGPVYSAWAELLGQALAGEVRAWGAQGGPESAHVRTSRPLPDPRDEGSSTFLPALLAPVRLGAILTRADLASLAGRLDLGLRAGERRYALEHLLAQDAPAVLGGLGDECDRQAEIGRSVSDRFGGADTVAGRSIATLASRGEGSAALLRALAEESHDVVAEATGSR
jgi:hypothetical protein